MRNDWSVRAVYAAPDACQNYEGRDRLEEEIPILGRRKLSGSRLPQVDPGNGFGLAGGVYWELEIRSGVGLIGRKAVNGYVKDTFTELAEWPRGISTRMAFVTPNASSKERDRGCPSAAWRGV